MLLASIDVRTARAEGVAFADPVRNTVVSDGQFVRLAYHGDHGSTTGVCVHLRAHEWGALEQFERDILALYNQWTRSLKQPSYVFCHANDVPDRAVVRISGVWDTARAYGLAFRYWTLDDHADDPNGASVGDGMSSSSSESSPESSSSCV